MEGTKKSALFCFSLLLSGCAFIPIQKTTVAGPDGGSTVCTQRGAGAVSYWYGKYRYDKCLESAQEMGAGLKRLIGQPLAVAVQKLGYPSDKGTVIGSDTVYVWENSGCTIKAGVGADSLISHADFDGDRSDCKQYRDILAAK